MEKPLAGKNILVVEDETVFRSVIAGFLSSLGATIHQAENGLVALEQLKIQVPDLILCDLAMPVMGGLSLSSAY